MQCNRVLFQDRSLATVTRLLCDDKYLLNGIYKQLFVVAQHFYLVNVRFRHVRLTACIIHAFQVYLLAAQASRLFASLYRDIGCMTFSVCTR